MKEIFEKKEKEITKVKNGITELVFILDRSGSMSGLEADTIGGFNSMLEKQKKEEGKTYVTTVLFDYEADVIHDRAELKDVVPMTRDTYFVRGSTALFDAVGGAIKHISKIHKYARREDVPENTMFVIITDGMENSSKRYSRSKVREMIEHEKEKYGWEFIFIGANIDAAETAESFGIGRDRSVDYIADSEGTQTVYEAVSMNISNVRACKAMADDWSETIKADYKLRKGK